MWDEIAQWEQALAHQSLANQTRVQYLQDIRRFAAWMYRHTSHHSITAVTVVDAWTYWQTLKGYHYTVATIRRALQSLHLFTSVMTAQKLTPFRSVLVWTRLHLHLLTALSAAEWQAVQEAAWERRKRDRGQAHALVQLTYSTGLAPEALVLLQRTDVIHQRQQSMLRVAPATSVPLEGDAYQALKHYWEATDTMRATHHLPDDSANDTSPPSSVFMGQRGPLTGHTIRLVLTQVGRLARCRDPLEASHLQALFLRQIFVPSAYGCMWDATFVRLIHAALQQSASEHHDARDYDLSWLVERVHAAWSQDS